MLGKLLVAAAMPATTSPAATARGRRIVLTPWQRRVRNDHGRSGMLEPQEGEVAWLTAEGALPGWRGSVTDLGYRAAS